MFEKVSQSLKYDSIFFVHKYIYIWTPTPITLPRSCCACGVMTSSLTLCDAHLYKDCHEASPVKAFNRRQQKKFYFSCSVKAVTYTIAAVSIHVVMCLLSVHRFRLLFCPYLAGLFDSACYYLLWFSSSKLIWGLPAHACMLSMCALINWRSKVDDVHTYASGFFLLDIDISIYHC